MPTSSATSPSSRLRLSLGCGNYDINQGLISGEVSIGGVDLVPLTMSSPERHWRLLRHHEFDICELSMASYLAMRDTRSHPYIAIPVFPHRRFRHSYLFVNKDAGIRSPRDLEGKSVGLRTWQTTAGLWTRGILQEPPVLVRARHHQQHQEDRNQQILLGACRADQESSTVRRLISPNVQGDTPACLGAEVELKA